jgi:hypothetical protein
MTVPMSPAILAESPARERRRPGGINAGGGK